MGVYEFSTNDHIYIKLANCFGVKADKLTFNVAIGGGARPGWQGGSLLKLNAPDEIPIQVAQPDPDNNELGFPKDLTIEKSIKKWSIEEEDLDKKAGSKQECEWWYGWVAFQRKDIAAINVDDAINVALKAATPTAKGGAGTGDANVQNAPVMKLPSLVIPLQSNGAGYFIFVLKVWPTEKSHTVSGKSIIRKRAAKSSHARRIRKVGKIPSFPRNLRACLIRRSPLPLSPARLEVRGEPMSCSAAFARATLLIAVSLLFTFPGCSLKRGGENPVPSVTPAERAFISTDNEGPRKFVIRDRLYIKQGWFRENKYTFAVTIIGRVRPAWDGHLLKLNAIGEPTVEVVQPDTDNEELGWQRVLVISPSIEKWLDEKEVSTRPTGI